MTAFHIKQDADDKTIECIREFAVERIAIIMEDGTVSESYAKQYMLDFFRACLYKIEGSDSGWKLTMGHMLKKSEVIKNIAVDFGGDARWAIRTIKITRDLLGF